MKTKKGVKEIQTIIQTYQEKKANNFKMALATVIGVEGSSYRRAGARMLMLENGTWIGGVSGGCLEGDLLKKAQKVMFTNQASVVTYDTSEDDPYQIGVGLGCRGVIDILIAPINEFAQHNPIFALTKCVASRASKLLLTLVKNNSHLTMKEGEAFVIGDSPQGLESYFAKEIASIQESNPSQISTVRLNSEEQITVFIERLLPPIQLFVFGSEYDIYPLLEMGQTLGWKLNVIANPLRIRKNIRAYCTLISNQERVFPLDMDERSAILLMTHDYQKDYQHLKQIVQTACPYIGLLGPKKRGDKLLEALVAEDMLLSVIQKEKIHSPVGLDIGANSPEEIALSILSEIQAFFGKRKGQSLKNRRGAIHSDDEVMIVE